MEDIATVCRRLADYHGMSDLPERLEYAVRLQARQRAALSQAADRLAAYEAEVKRLRARVAELEVCKGGGVGA
jgi:hypothetical protein